jgi:hypothetical protein
MIAVFPVDCPDPYGRGMARRVLLVAVSLAVLLAAAPAVALPVPPVPAVPELPLGAPGLPEVRTTQQLAPGVMLTSIVRGEVDPAARWTVEAAIPAGPASAEPGAPTAVVTDRQTAEDFAAGLRSRGLDPRVEEVTAPPFADHAGGTIGYRVRLGSYPDRESAQAGSASLRAASAAGSAVYTGWDRDPDARGPWRLQVLRIDPAEFRGRLTASFGPDLQRTERTSDLAAARGATAAVNAGFFVMDPASGAPGDPAGVGLYDGRFLSEPVAPRSGLVLRPDVRLTRVVRFTWRGGIVAPDGTMLRLDGINRVPGYVRNCGGTADDRPTSAPLQDVTCTDPDELVLFTPEFGASTPAGPGLEAVLDRAGTVLAVRSPRGGPVPAYGRTVQATGTFVEPLRAAAPVGAPVHVGVHLRDEQDRMVRPGRGTSIVNGGPELVRDGEVHATPATDGLVRAGDPAVFYRLAVQRNPRTFAGVDGSGRTYLVTADGRSTASLGLSLDETAAVAQALGMREALNLDGGGSTTMVARGVVVNRPSDAAGERSVGDAVLVLSCHRT